MEEEAVKNAVSASEVEISDNMVELELDNMVQDMDRRLSYQGLKFDQYLKMLGKSMADFRTESRETAKDSIKTRLVLEAIAKDIKVEVKDEDVKAKVAELANTYGRKEEELMENEELKEQVKTSLETEKTIAYLLDNAKATVKKAEKKEAKADSSEKEDKKETAKKTK
jgi:trigger factor